jgi:rhodanese-related sulfurtransferase
MAVSEISPQRLAELCKERGKIDLIDVRTPKEYRQVHVEFAQNIPLSKLDPAAVAQSRAAPADEPIYLICHSGKRGQLACEQFQKAGFANVVNIAGGTQACVEAGLPAVHGKAAISIERQVRIVIGFFVLLGVALGWLVHPAFYAIPAFLGAGLIFSGIADFCGMAMLLARMPWNR